MWVSFYTRIIPFIVGPLVVYPPLAHGGFSYHHLKNRFNIIRFTYFEVVIVQEYKVEPFAMINVHEKSARIVYVFLFLTLFWFINEISVLVMVHVYYQSEQRYMKGYTF